MTPVVLEGRLVLPDRVLERGQVVLEGCQIVEVVMEAGRYPATLDYGESYLAPGFIDLHAHGIAGADVMDASVDSLRLVARRVAARGATSFLPSTVTAGRAVLRGVIECVRRVMDEPGDDESRVLGVHLEGPWISTAFKGAQNEAFIEPPRVEAARELLEVAPGTVRRVSLAPELPGSEDLARALIAAGVLVSIAHTGATYEQTIAAAELGASHVTHCFNGMSGFHHRAPGVAGGAMLRDDLFVELIPDGLHVHPGAMELLIRVKGRERVMLVTDSMAATELNDGVYSLGGKEVFVRGGDARLADGTLASSTLTMDRAVRELVTRCAVSLVDAVFMAATTPAIAIGLGSSLGALRPGYVADLVVLGTDLNAQATWVAGRRLG